MRERFAALFSHLTVLQRTAERERNRDSIAARVDREKSIFMRDRLTGATKADVVLLLEQIESIVVRSVEGDKLLIAIRRIWNDFDLDSDLNDKIEEFDTLKSRIETLKYVEILASQS